MKIGFSFGRCLRDIVMGKVDIDDVVVIVTRTNMERQHIESVVAKYAYQQDYLAGLSQERCLEIAYALFDSGRLHQPRAFGSYRQRVPEGSVWFDLFPTAHTDVPSVKAAWEKYRMTLLLAGAVKNNTTEDKIY